MFVYLLLLLPKIEAANIVISDYSITQVKIEGDGVKVLTNTIDEDDDESKHLRKKNQEAMLKELGMGFLIPRFETEGQKRFMKIRYHDKPARFKLGVRAHDKDGGENKTQTLPMLQLIGLFTKLLEYVPLFLNLG
uniref:Uncharacterized protein n=1 Tax=Heliothis virescens TaxID=7102 RepID=A0A2A4JV58_HELVI